MGPKPTAGQLVAPPTTLEPSSSRHRSKYLKGKRAKGIPLNSMCSAKNRFGEPCGKRAMTGLEVCSTHGGRTRAAVAKSERAIHQLQAEVAIKKELRKLEKLGGNLDVDPLDVMLQQVGEAAANVEVLRSYIAGLDVEIGEDGSVALPEKEVYWDKGGTYVQARVHIFVAMYNEERDRLVKYAKMCVDAGVDERRVRVAELQAQRLGQAFAAALEDVRDYLTGEAVEALKEALAKRLRALGG